MKEWILRESQYYANRHLISCRARYAHMMWCIALDLQETFAETMSKVMLVTKCRAAGDPFAQVRWIEIASPVPKHYASSQRDLAVCQADTSESKSYCIHWSCLC